LAVAGVHHGFFTRNGHAEERHGNTNYAFRTPADTESVSAARAACAARVGATTLVTVKQRHTADVVAVDQPWSWEAAPIADALVTGTRGVALGILTADCAPILLADAERGVIGAAHAGWRGALDGVIANTVAAMRDLGAAPARMVAAVGPCIGPMSYEVGPEFVAQFTAVKPDFARYFDHSRARPHFDLPRFVADRLRDAGVGTVVVEGSDTLADEGLFFSFRRATLRREPDYGRQISVIALEAR
jgi:YfiH family protein